MSGLEVRLHPFSNWKWAISFMFQCLYPHKRSTNTALNRGDCFVHGVATKVTLVFSDMTLPLGEQFVTFQRSHQEPLTQRHSIISHDSRIIVSHLVQVLTHLTCVWLVPGSYLGWDTPSLTEFAWNFPQSIHQLPGWWLDAYTFVLHSCNTRGV